LITEVFQRFFEQWDGCGGGTITSDRMDEARAVFSRGRATTTRSRFPKPTPP
jgi:hypothetical protein